MFHTKIMDVSRRQFIRAGLAGVAGAVLASRVHTEVGALPLRTLRIALLHLAPFPGDLAHNRRLIETAVTTAAGPEVGAAWIMTPELAVCGYSFADRIGTEWILPQPDPWMEDFCRLVSRLRATVFLSHPERDRSSNHLHNTVFVIAPDGTIAGKHRKINTLRVGSEAWSSPGDHVAPLPVPPFRSVGIMICADAFSPAIPGSLKAQEAEFLVSSAAWGPGLHGPNGEWERCTGDTGLPLVVCNRTGRDVTLDFTGAQSIVAKGGRRLLSMSSERSAIFVVDWDLTSQELIAPNPRRIDL